LFSGTPGSSASSVGHADAVLDRAGCSIDLADTVLARACGTADHAEAVVARAGRTVDGTDAVVNRAAGSVDEVQSVIARADGTVRGADEAVTRALGTVAAAGGVVRDVDAVLARVTEPVDQLLPLARRLAETLTPREVEAFVLLLDRLPDLLAMVDSDVAPLIRALSDVAPDVHDVLKILDDLHQLASGLPGAKLLRKRGVDDPVQPHRSGTVLTPSRREV
jgi:hypothetical protein